MERLHLAASMKVGIKTFCVTFCFNVLKTAGHIMMIFGKMPVTPLRMIGNCKE